MAATKTQSALHAFTSALLTLPGMVPKLDAATPIDSVNAGFNYSHYEECCDRISVDVYHLSGSGTLEDQARLNSNFIIDKISGSSPVLNIPESAVDVVGCASGVCIGKNSSGSAGQPIQVLSSATIRDTRYAGDFAASYFFEELTTKISGGVSDENDYLSGFVNLDAEWEMDHKMTTWAFSTGYISNRVESTDRDFSDTNNVVKGLAGLTRVLDKYSLVQTNFSYTFNTGYLSNPYKKVFIDGGGRQLQDLDATQDNNVFFERRPNQRHQFALMGRYIRHFSDTDGSLHLDARLYTDTWGVNSLTVETSWHQALPENWAAIPRFRYYSQDQADFYSPYFLAPRQDGNYSSDYRLSGFGALSGGIMLTREFFDQLQINVSFEYTQQSAGLKLGGKTQSGFADFSYTLVTAGLNFRF